LCAELAERHELKREVLPPRAGEDAVFFEAILSEVAQRSGAPVWIVIDALNEAISNPGQNRLMLPAHLPAGAYVFLTQRPNDVPFQIDAGTPLEDFEIAWDSHEQSRAITEFLETQARGPTLSLKFATHDPPLDANAFIRRLSNASQGNFVYLSYLLSDLAAGTLPLSDVAGAALPGGLRGYYEATWQRMQALARSQDGAEGWRTLYRPLIGFLAAAREPFTVRWLAELTGRTSLDVKEALSAWRSFLALEVRNGTEAWRILHLSFAEFLAEPLDLAEFHAAIAAWCRAPRNANPRGGYVARRLSVHLREAKMFEELFALTRDAEWRARQIQTDPTGGARHADLEQAWLAAAALDTEAASNGDALPALDQEIRLALSTVSFKRAWRDIRPSTLAAFVNAGLLDPAQALEVVARNPDDLGRSLALQTLAPLLNNETLLVALGHAEAIVEPAHRAETLVAFAQHSEAVRQPDLLQRALELARRADPNLRPEALRRVAAEMSGEEARAARAEAFKAAEHLSEAEDRAEALTALAADMPGAPEVLAAALEAARAVEDPAQCADKLAALLPLLAPETQRREAHEIKDTILPKLSDPTGRVDALTRISWALEPREREELLASLRADCERINDPAVMAIALLSFSDTLPEPGRTALVDELDHSIRRPDAATPGQAIALANVAIRVPAPRNAAVLLDALALIRRECPAEDRLGQLLTFGARDSLPGRLRDMVFVEAEATARELSPASAQARALLRVGVALDDLEHLRRLAREASAESGSLLFVDGGPNDALEQVELMCVLAPHLDRSASEAAVGEAARVAETIAARPFEYGKALVALVRAGEPVATARAEAIGELASMLTDPAERAELLIAVAASLPVERQIPLLDKAEAAAMAIEPGQKMASGVIDLETGVVHLWRASEFAGSRPAALARILALTEEPKREALLEEALLSIYSLPPRQQAREIEALGPSLPHDRAQALLNAYRTILQDPLRAEIVAAARAWRDDGPPPGGPGAAEGPGPSTPESVALSEEEAGEEVKFSLECSHVTDWFRLTADLGQGVFRIRFNGTEPRRSAEDQEEIERAVVRSFVQQAIADPTQIDPNDVDWREIAAGPMRASLWRRAVAALIRRMAETSSAEAAVEAACEIWPSGLPPEVLRGLDGLIDRREQQIRAAQSLRWAQGLDEGGDRAQALALLLPLVSAPDRAATTGQMVGALEGATAQDADAEWLRRRVAMSDADALPAPVVLASFQRALRNQRNPEDLISLLRDTAPLYLRLGGERVATAVAEALSDTARHWDAP
jgi:hypothetical protein